MSKHEYWILPLLPLSLSLSLSLSLFPPPLSLSLPFSISLRFPNMGILHVTKKKVPEVLTRRLLQQLKMRDTAGLDQLDMEGQQNLSEGMSAYIVIYYM